MLWDKRFQPKQIARLLLGIGDATTDGKALRAEVFEFCSTTVTVTNRRRRLSSVASMSDDDGFGEIPVPRKCNGS